MENMERTIKERNVDEAFPDKVNRYNTQKIKNSCLKKSPELSVIVPIYNVEKWLKRCLNSILCQTFENFELILIDDGSPDDCANIIEKYAEKDKRIITIHQKNKGVSAARNAGLRIAKGKYIGFVDPDDWIAPQMYEKLVNAIQREDADIACCSWSEVDAGYKIQNHYINCGAEASITGEEFALHLFDRPRTIGGSNCNKLFKRNKIHQLYDERVIICEDNYFLSCYIRQVKKAVIINECLYFIFSREDSAIRKNPERVVLGLPTRRQMIYEFSKISRKLRDNAEADFLDACLGKLRLLNYDSEYYEVAKTEFSTYIHENLWSVIRNISISRKLKVVYLITYWKMK